MEMTPELESMIYDPITIAIGIGSIVGWFLCIGLAMKGALALVADETPTLRRAIFIVFFIAFAQMFAAFAMTLVLPAHFLFLGNFVLIYMNLKILASFADISLMRAFCASFLNGVFSIILHILLFLGVAFAVCEGIVERHPVAFEQFRNIVEENDDAILASLQEKLNVAESDSDDATFGNEPSSGSGSLQDLRNVFFSDSDSDSAETESADDSGSGFGSWFSGSSEGSVDVAPTDVTTQTKTYHPGRNIDSGMPLQFQPVVDTSKQKGNPFVK